MKLSHKIPTYGSIVIIRLAAEAAAGRESVKYNNTHPTFLFNITDDLVEAINGLSEAKNVPKLCMHHQSAKQPYYNASLSHSGDTSNELFRGEVITGGLHSCNQQCLATHATEQAKLLYKYNSKLHLLLK